MAKMIQEGDRRIAKNIGITAMVLIGVTFMLMVPADLVG